MQVKIVDEGHFQILSSNMTIGPSTTGYNLMVSADGENFSSLFSVGAGVTRLCTNMGNGAYYYLQGNSGEVVVNWQRQTSEGGGGTSGVSFIDIPLVEIEEEGNEIYYSTTATNDEIVAAVKGKCGRFIMDEVDYYIPNYYYDENGVDSYTILYSTENFDINLLLEDGEVEIVKIYKYDSIHNNTDHYSYEPIYNITSLTQADYDNLEEVKNGTLYFIIELED